MTLNRSSEFLCLWTEDVQNKVWSSRCASDLGIRFYVFFSASAQLCRCYQGTMPVAFPVLFIWPWPEAKMAIISMLIKLARMPRGHGDMASLISQVCGVPPGLGLAVQPLAKQTSWMINLDTSKGILHKKCPAVVWSHAGHPFVLKNLGRSHGPFFFWNFNPCRKIEATWVCAVVGVPPSFGKIRPVRLAKDQLWNLAGFQHSSEKLLILAPRRNPMIPTSTIPMKPEKMIQLSIPSWPMISPRQTSVTSQALDEA